MMIACDRDDDDDDIWRFAICICDPIVWPLLLLGSNSNSELDSASASKAEVEAEVPMNSHKALSTSGVLKAVEGDGKVMGRGWEGDGKGMGRRLRGPGPHNYLHNMAITYVDMHTLSSIGSIGGSSFFQPVVQSRKCMNCIFHMATKPGKSPHDSSISRQLRFAISSLLAAKSKKNKKQIERKKIKTGRSHRRRLRPAKKLNFFTPESIVIECLRVSWPTRPRPLLMQIFPF